MKNAVISILILVIINFVVIIKINNEDHANRIFTLEQRVEVLNDIITVMFYNEVEYEEDDGTLN